VSKRNHQPQRGCGIFPFPVTGNLPAKSAPTLFTPYPVDPVGLGIELIGFDFAMPVPQLTL
jgi:hypothetical protein